MDEETLPEIDIESSSLDPREDKPVPYLPLNIQGTSKSTQANNQFPLGVPSYIYQPTSSQATVTADTIPLTNVVEESKGKPGWWKTAAHEFYNYNLELQAGTFVGDALFGDNPLQDIAPDGWTAMHPDSVEGYARNYWDYLTSSQSPKDLQMRQQKVREQMEQDEYFESGSWSAKIIGGSAGAFISPSTMFLMPAITTMKYAGVAQSTIMNALRTAPAVGLDAFARNSFIQANRVGGSMEQAAFDSMRDTVFGSALIGLGSGLSASGRELNLWHTKDALNASYEGIGIGHEFIDNGKTITGRAVAYPLAGTSVGAKEVSVVQTWVDESMKKSPFYAIPGAKQVTDKLLSIPGTDWLKSPAILAERSPYKAAKYFYNRIAGNPFISKSEMEGIATPDSAQLIADMFGSRALDFTQLNKDAFFRANGIEGGDAARSLKNFQQTVTNQRTITMSDFTKEVRSVVEVEGYKSSYSQAHEVADAAMQMMDDVNQMHSQLTGRPLFKDPRTAFKYLPNAYNVNYLKNNRDVFVQTTAAILQKQDQRIKDLHAPIQKISEELRAAQAAYDSAKKFKAPSGQLKSMQSEISRLKGHQVRENERLRETLLSNADDELLLEGRPLLTLQEENKLKGILQPLKELESKIAEHERTLKSLERKVKSTKDSVNKSIYKDDSIALRKEIERIRGEHDSLRNELHQNALEGKINQKLFETDGYEVNFHNPNEPLKFRSLYESENARNNAAEAWHETITNSSPQDLIQMVFGGMPQIEGSPSYLKSRKIMIPSNEFTQAGFFEPDISKTITSYMQSMGRVIGFKSVFPEFAHAKDFSGVLKGLKQEHDFREAEILKDAPSKERDKKMSKINKEFEKATKLMSDTYKTYMGQYASQVDKNTKAGASILKNITGMARLGSIVAYQVSDLGGIILKHGLMPFMASGIKPLLQTANGHIKGPRAEIYKAQAADCGLAVNTLMRGSSMRFMNQFASSDAPVSGLMEKSLGTSEALSHLSSNFYGINYISDMNERLAANVFQSSVMRVANKFLAGTATKSEIADMAHYGIDMKEWAQKFVDQSKSAGGYQENKWAYQSMYHMWEDAEAVSRMGKSIRRASEDTILNSNKYASPYWTQHPLYGLIFMFHGWAYNAFNRYTVPILQRPDAQRILGFTSIVGLSMLSEPLMRLSNGKTAFEDDSTWFDAALKGLDYSGFGGPGWELMANLNKAMGNSLWTGQSEKRKNYQGVGAFAGPAIGLAYDVAQLGGHGIKGNWTQSDARKLAHLFVPFDHILSRGIVDNFIKNSGLPENRRHAENWSYWDSLHGENK